MNYLKAVTTRDQSRRQIRELAVQIFFGQLQTLPFIAGGAAMALNYRDTLYAIAFGIMVIFFASTANAWILLVEILR